MYHIVLDYGSETIWCIASYPNRILVWTTPTPHPLIGLCSNLQESKCDAQTSYGSCTTLYEPKKHLVTTLQVQQRDDKELIILSSQPHAYSTQYCDSSGRGWPQSRGFLTFSKCSQMHTLVSFHYII